MEQAILSPPPIIETLRDFSDLFRPSRWKARVAMGALAAGDGHPVLVVPGLFSADYSTGPTRAFLTRLGYDVHGWNLGVNLGPTVGAARGLEERLIRLNERTGRRVSLIGHSLGGVFLRELAKTHPDRVRHLVLVCSPVKHPVPSHFSKLLYSFDRFYDPDYPRDPIALSRPAPVPTTALYTRIDGYIAWQSCLEDASELAQNIELFGARHCTAIMHPQALEAIAVKLALPDRA